MSDSTKSATQVNDYPSIESINEINLTQLQRDVLFYLRYFARKFNNFITISVKNLMVRFNRKDTAIRDALRALIKAGLIKRNSHRGKGHTALTTLTSLAFEVMDLLTNTNKKIMSVTKQENETDGQTDGQNESLYMIKEKEKDDQSKDDLVSKWAKKYGLDESQTEKIRALHAKADHSKIRKPIAFLRSLIIEFKEGIAAMLKTPEQRAERQQLETTLKQTATELVDAHLLKEGVLKPSTDLSTYANPDEFLPAIHAYEQRRDGMINATLNKLRIENGLAKVDKDPKPHNPRYAKPVNVKHKHDWQTEVYG